MDRHGPAIKFKCRGQMPSANTPPPNMPGLVLKGFVPCRKLSERVVKNCGSLFTKYICDNCKKNSSWEGRKT